MSKQRNPRSQPSVSDCFTGLMPLQLKRFISARKSQWQNCAANRLRPLYHYGSLRLPHVWVCVCSSCQSRLHTCTTPCGYTPGLLTRSLLEGTTRRTVDEFWTTSGEPRIKVGGVGSMPDFTVGVNNRLYHDMAACNLRKSSLHGAKRWTQ